MKSVKVEVTTPDGRDTTAVGVYVEENRGGSGGWHRLDGKDAVTNKGSVTLTVRPNQRIIIDAYPTPEMVYDREQGAAINPNTQRNDENKADAAERNPKPSDVQKQEDARLKKAGELQGAGVPPTGQALPPTSAQAAQPSSGPSGTPLKGSTVGEQTGQPKPQAAASPNQPAPKTAAETNNPTLRAAAENERNPAPGNKGGFTTTSSEKKDNK